MSENIFKNTKPAVKAEVEDDYIGGGGVLDTDIYSGKIKYAYIGKAQNSDARNVTICVEVNGVSVTEQIWMTNREGDVTYTDRKTQEKKNLPGFNKINSLCMLIAGKEVGDMDVEDKVLQLYDYESKKELPQSVPCFVDLHGEEVQVAIQRQTVDKTQKNESTGNYEPTGETRDINTFVKFFPSEKLVTISEVAHFVKSLGGEMADVLGSGDMAKAIAKMPEGEYGAAWLEKNRGKTWNRATGNASGKSFGASSSGGDTKKSSANLFDD